MLTSCNHSITLHFTKFRPKILPNHRNFSVFLMHSSSQVRQNTTARMVTNVEKSQKSKKADFFFVNIFFLKVKMDILSMSFFKKKDRILTNFFPASFHLAGLKILASKILLSQKKSEISTCPNRGYASASCACAHAIVS